MSASDSGPHELRIAEARKAHERGWSLVPVKGKAPIQKGWSTAPCPSLEAVEAWAKAHNLGVRTGAVSGIVVIDEDTEKGGSVANLDLPKTVTVVTGGGGRHYYFRAPDCGLGNTVSKLSNGVDVRGDGGQVVFVGSVHPETGVVYSWLDGHSPEDLELAELPSAIVDLLKASKNPKPAPQVRREGQPGTSAVRKVLASAAEGVRAAPEGKRNDALNRGAYTLGSWVGEGLLDRDTVVQELTAAALAAGLDPDEIGPTIESGLSKGEANPIHPRGGRPRSLDTLDGSSSAGSADLPSIVMEGGLLPEHVDQAEQALLAAPHETIYQQGTQLVRPVRVQPSTMREVHQGAEGTLILCEVDPVYLVEVLTRSARWFSESKTGLTPIDCPPKVANTYLARKGSWKLPRLLGVIEAPTIRPDGSILQTPGYDPDSCLYFDPGATEFPAIPEQPTREGALAALGEIKFILKDFPWLEPSDQSAALAAILTSLVRQSIRTAPLFAFRAPKMASGKSLLADVVSLFCTGRTCPVMSQGKDEVEDQKRLLAILMEGTPVSCIDNIERPLGGSALCSVLTQESWRERVLGKTGTETVSTTTTWIATGNNISFTGDITTRVVVADLDPRCERPEERVFDFDPREYVPKHRGALVAAALTILKAHHDAGRPSMELSPIGRFEDWSGWIRSSLVWLGEPDPNLGRSRIEATDPIRGQLVALLEALKEQFKDGYFTTADAVQVATRSDASAMTPLGLAIAEVASGPRGGPDRLRLGKFLSRHERRLEGGLRIERRGTRKRAVRWVVVGASDPGGLGGPPPEGVSLVSLVSQIPPVRNSIRPDAAPDEDLGTKSNFGGGEINSPNSPNSPTGAPAGRDQDATGPLVGGDPWTRDAHDEPEEDA